MRLIGAKRFLETVKPGTLCVEFWEDTKEECLQIIKDFKNGEDIIKKYNGEFYIFGDNSGSLSFTKSDDNEEYRIGGKTYHCLFYYDKNICGDACPETTLQLVFESEDEYPNKIYVEDYDEFGEESGEELTKEDVVKIKNWFLQDAEFFEYEWALEHLKTRYKDDFIVNFDSKKGD